MVLFSEWINPFPTFISLVIPALNLPKMLQISVVGNGFIRSVITIIK